MLPFRKRQDDGVSPGPIEVKERKPDEAPGYDMLDAVAEDILAAVSAGDKAMLKEALAALVTHIQEADELQDMGSEA